MTHLTSVQVDETAGQSYRMDAALRKLLEESHQWDAAAILAQKYFRDAGTKFVTEFQYKGRWIVIQWVTTYSKIFATVPLASPGRVGISRRRRKALRHMARSRWLLDESEPVGLTLAVRFFPHLGASK